jgi:thiamine pyrophosphokinase
MRIIVLANGVLTNPESIHHWLSGVDLIIAADGGARHCQTLGLVPQVIIGDMDSLEPHELDAFRASGVEIIRHPPRKDYTDLELALRLAVDRGGTELLVLGALGQRWDMTMANMLLLTMSRLSGVVVRIIDGAHEIMLMSDRDRVELSGRKGDILSLVPLGRDAIGVTLTGLEYPLKNDTLKVGSTRGISNVFLGPTAVVELDRGLLLCIVLHHDQDATGSM